MSMGTPLTAGFSGHSARAAVPAAKFDTGDTVRRLNEFLCEEIAAELAYQVAADRLGGAAADYLGLLRQFQEEHGLAAEALRDQIRELGGETADTCGTLGAWSPAAHETAAAGLLRLLRAGERRNLDDYRDSFDHIDPSSVDLMENLLIPAQRRHIQVLDELIGKAADA